LTPHLRIESRWIHGSFADGSISRGRARCRYLLTRAGGRSRRARAPPSRNASGDNSRDQAVCRQTDPAAPTRFGCLWRLKQIPFSNWRPLSPRGRMWTGMAWSRSAPRRISLSSYESSTGSPESTGPPIVSRPRRGLQKRRAPSRFLATHRVIHQLSWADGAIWS
jgi:hypothetical protein